VQDLLDRPEAEIVQRARAQKAAKRA
jgi:hypothetical protein